MKITIDKETIDVDVDSAGIFRATYDEEDYREESLSKLKEKIEAAAKRVRDTRLIPVTVLNLVSRPKSKQNYGYREDPYIDGRGAVHATFRGKHARTSAYLLTSDTGIKFQLSNYGGGASWLCRLLSDEEIAEYRLLAQAVDDAQVALEKFRQRVHVSPESLL